MNSPVPTSLSEPTDLRGHSSKFHKTNNLLMKQLARSLSLLLLVSAGIFFSNCGGSDDEEPSEEETQLNALKGTWTLSEVTLDGNSDDRFDGANLKLTFQGNFSEGGKYDYSLSSDIQVDSSPFPGSGKWKFGSPVTSRIIRLDSELDGSYDDVEMEYSVDGSTLELSFNYEGSNFVIGRTASVTGQWVFTFTK